MDLEFINNFFRYGPFAINIAVLLFFLWQIHLIGPTKKFLSRLVFWTKGELPEKLLLGSALFLVVFNLLFAALKTGVQYWAWKTGGPFSQAFLPPITPITYFLGYAGFRFWLPIAINVAIAAIFFFTVYLSRKRQGRFFYKGEESLAAISILAVGWPALIVYLACILLAMIIASFLNTFRKTSSYTSFVYLWLPLALFALLFGNHIIRALGLQVLFITGS